jgi:hypothetical protein
VFAVGVAPTRAAFAVPWTPPTPTLQCGPVTVAQGRPVQHCRTVMIPHNLTGRVVAMPAAVVGVTACISSRVFPHFHHAKFPTDRVGNLRHDRGRSRYRSFMTQLPHVR